MTNRILKLLRLAIQGAMALALTLFAATVMAQAGTKNFDHLKTGFPLTGVHTNARCESCHVKGVFKGTPKDCASCHTSGLSLARNNVVKNPQHLPTMAGCENCHTTQNFTTAKFSHDGVVAGACATCHNGSTAPGKSANHTPTQASCDTCHMTTAWLPARGADHSAFTSATNCASCHVTGGSASGKGPNHVGTTINTCMTCHKAGYPNWKPAKYHVNVATVTANCASCHNGSIAVTKSSNHVSTTAVCETCHKSTTTWVGTKVNHGTFTAATNCSTCHNGTDATGKDGNHVTTSTNTCMTCHKAGYPNWLPAKYHVNVAAVTTNCASCHNGTIAVTKSSSHVSTNAVCETCHKSTTTWVGTKVNHSAYTAATNCSTCHNGTDATGKDGNHVTTSTNTCMSCHKAGYPNWLPALYHPNVAPVTTNCASCHNGVIASAKSQATHIPTTVATCETCHQSNTAWKPAKFHSNVTVVSGCASCHATSSYGVTAKPNNATHTNVTVCETCHKSTSTWAGTKVDHSKYTAATNCSSCHNGTDASGKSNNHVSTTIGTCMTCHKGGYPNWLPAKYHANVAAVTTNCASCHNGLTASAKPQATHIPTTVSACETCHQAGNTSWKPAKFHSNVTVVTGCASCHATSTYGVTAKPNNATHASVTVCENCHKSTSTWAGTKVDHSKYTAATNCSSCHNGADATGKTGNHVSTTIGTCMTCHKGGYPNWLPAKYHINVAPVVSNCLSCHNGVIASVKPSSHFPTTAACETCHQSNTAWKPAKFHSNVTVVTGCANCHATATYGLTAKPNTATHVGATVCESCHKSTINWLSVQYTHAAANVVGTGTCDNCHNGSTAAVSKSAVHIPVPAGAAKCDSCHKSQVSFNTSVTMNHSVVTAATCKSCHNGTYISQGNAGGAMAKPSNHVPESQLLNGAAMDCKTCHATSTTAWNEKMDHNGSQGSGSGWCKGCHASGTAYLGNMQKKAVSHKTLNGVIQGDCSTSGCHKPLGNRGTTYSNWD